MRLLTLSAALILLAAGPALAGDRGGGHGGGHGGGGHQPPPRPGPCCGGGGHGGGSTNINVNVNASARAYANASAGSYINARTYDMGGFRGGGYGGGTVYVGGGGYGGDIGGYGGTAVYNEIASSELACASAPFGYTVAGFGREIRGPAYCSQGGGDHRYEEDRGGRYGYSERHESYEESSYERYESYEEYGAFESSETYEDHDRRDADYRDDRGYREETDHRVGDYDRGYMDGRRDCDCRDGTPYPPPYIPEPPRYEPPAPPPARPHRPHRPRQDAPPRQEYRQEIGERG